MVSLVWILVAFVLFACLTHGTNLTAQQATEAGVDYFVGRCATQQGLVNNLISSIVTGNLDDAIVSYVDSRPPYEEIEVLAPAFSDLDEAIDARPYVFGNGEDNPNFKGFHRIERDLYRDSNIAGALEHAKELNESVASLCRVLSEKTAFTPRKSWEGLLGLALEVPAKKVASEEETWSDLSIMIFRANYRGIYETYKPFTKMSPGASNTSITEVETTYAQLQDMIDFIDPVNGFSGKNGGKARPYSDVTISERAEIIRLSYKFVRALTKVHAELEPNFPPEEGGAENEEEEGPVVDSSQYTNETLQGVRYFAEQCSVQLTTATRLYAVLNSSDVTLRAAKSAYVTARPAYEQIETIAGSFEDEDRFIDARPYAIDNGELSSDWQGFHLVERALYRNNDLRAALKGMPDLMKAINSLCNKLNNPIETNTFSADTTWGGMIALAYEVPSKKISSEEETWSDLSLLIFRENVKGIGSQFKPFEKAVSPESARNVMRAMDEVKRFLEMVDFGNDWRSGLNFRPYSEVTIVERKGISDRFYTMARALVAARSTLASPAPSNATVSL